MSESESNRREHTRHQVEMAGKIRLASERTIEGRIENVGRGGAFFVTDDLEANVLAADPVELLLPDANGKESTVSGVVLRLETFFSGTDVLRSFAIQFDEPLPAGAF